MSPIGGVSRRVQETARTRLVLDFLPRFLHNSWDFLTFIQLGASDVVYV